jgi:hypothetical protein
MFTAGWGVVFQVFWADSPPIPLYLLRVVTALGVSLLFARARFRRDAVTDWLVAGVAVLALAQAAPTVYLNLGCMAAGYLAACGTFPAAALAGFALDLAGITPVPMTAVLCAGWLLRLIPRLPRTLRAAAAGLAYLPVMYFSGHMDLYPMAALLLGGGISAVLPNQPTAPPRRGETGAAQVRLEMAAEVMRCSQQLLLTVQESPVDEEALMRKAVSRACAGCPGRRECRDQKLVEKLQPRLLALPLMEAGEIGNPCRRSGRLLQELRRSQDQLRAMKLERAHRQEHRLALMQQYRFLSEYLQDLSDDLSRRMDFGEARFTPEIIARTRGKEVTNGDGCSWFPGPRCKYFLVLCDGMGTGMGAGDESKTAISMLKKLLTAGYPADHALQTLNSICALRSRAGAVTVDLLEIQLESGRANLYKWGAAPSYLLGAGGMQKIGTAGPPPGLSVEEERQTGLRLSLRRGETLLMLSDGAGGEEILRRAGKWADQAPGELALEILEGFDSGDDATVAVIRLKPASTLT